jgi:hypothetical protein
MTGTKVISVQLQRKGNQGDINRQLSTSISRKQHSGTFQGEGIGNASPKQQTRITANHYESV